MTDTHEDKETASRNVKIFGQSDWYQHKEWLIRFYGGSRKAAAMSILSDVQHLLERADNGESAGTDNPAETARQWINRAKSIILDFDEQKQKGNRDAC